MVRKVEWVGDVSSATVGDSLELTVPDTGLGSATTITVNGNASFPLKAEAAYTAAADGDLTAIGDSDKQKAICYDDTTSDVHCKIILAADATTGAQTITLTVGTTDYTGSFTVAAPPS